MLTSPAFILSLVGAATGLLVGILFVSSVLTNASTFIGSGTTTTPDTIETETNVATRMLDTTASTTKYLNATRPLIAENVNSTSSLIGSQINRIELSLSKAGTPTGTAEAGVYRIGTTTNVQSHMNDFTASTNHYLNTTRPLIGENVNATSTLINKSFNTLSVNLSKAGSPTGNVETGVFRFSTQSTGGNTTHMSDITASADSTVSQEDAIVMAMYFRPTPSGQDNVLQAKWQQVVTALQAHPTVEFMGIINPSSGPGTSVNFNGNYTKGIDAIYSNGGKVVAYVYSDYSLRPQADIIDDVQDYLTWYPGKIQGIFIDEMQNHNNQTQVEYYANLTRTIHNLGVPLTICNPGADTKDIFVGSCDKIMIEEGNGQVDVTRLRGQASASGAYWHNRFDQSNWVYSSYNRPTFNATEFKAYAQNYVSGGYWTNGTGVGCPDSGVWNCVPSYLDDQFVAIEELQKSGSDTMRSASLEYFGPSSSVVGDVISNIKIPLARTGTVLYGNYSVGVFYNNMTKKAEFGNGYAMDLTTSSVTYDFAKPTTSQTFDTKYRVVYNVTSLASRGMFNATGGTTIWAERAAASSTLIGDVVNNIEIVMSREGSPTGTMTAGVFDSSGALKYTFGTISSSSVAVGVHTYSFTNTGSTYTIVQDDRIGIQYNTGGDGTNLIRVYEKVVDRFDGTLSYRERWNWDTQAYVATTGADIIMDINRVTTTSGLPSTYTVQSGDYIGVYYPWGNSTQYIMTKVDNGAAFDTTNSVFAEQPGITTTITTKDQNLILVQTGTPTVTTTVTKVKDFGNIATSSLTGSLQNVTKQLSAGDSYTILQGDIVGVRYNVTGLTSADYINVAIDTTGGFDGTASKYISFDSSALRTYTNGSDVDLAIKSVSTSPFVTKAKDFGSLNPTTLTGSLANVTFSLGAGDSYTLASGDFVGIRYNQTGLTSADYINVSIDTDAANPFDGSASKYADYTQATHAVTYASNDDIYGAIKYVTTTETVIPGTTTTGTGDADAVRTFTAASGTIWAVVAILPIGLFFGLFALLNKFNIGQ